MVCPKTYPTSSNCVFYFNKIKKIAKLLYKNNNCPTIMHHFLNGTKHIWSIFKLNKFKFS